jgi:Raf kinase inhibitor-like YbhB/YbcL family protein
MRNSLITHIGAISFYVFCLTGMAHPADPFMLRSTAFEDNGVLAVKNAGNATENPNCVGQNVSPPLNWSNPPDGTVSFAIILYDAEGMGGLSVVHWIAYGIPISVTGFGEGEVSGPSDKFVGGRKTFGDSPFYFGPCTPPGDYHHYIFTLIATDFDPKALEPGLTREQLFERIKGHTKGAAGLVGRFRKP